ncbi:hypothetical protein N0V85_006178 [Neurospora sp. IMI 360204]|nr:hypothetical protein N0V85_006178 [Neurospora sp. IMI 360204]
MAKQTWKWKRWVEEEKTDDNWEMVQWDNDSREKREGTDLGALDMSWLDARKFNRNAALSPPEKWPKGPSGQRNTSKKQEVDCLREVATINQPEIDLLTLEQQT